MAGHGNYRVDDLASSSSGGVTVDLAEEMRVYDNIVGPRTRRAIQQAPYDEAISPWRQIFENVDDQTLAREFVRTAEEEREENQAAFEVRLAAGPIFDVDKVKQSMRRKRYEAEGR